jgi:hypothetical protein
VELALARQKLVFARSSGGEFVLTTFVRAGAGWRMLFDAGAPLMEGPSFGLQSARYRVMADTPDAKVIEFSGHHLQPGYDWTLRVEATAQTPLFRFTISCALPEPLPLRSPEPVVSLWMRHANPSFHLDQGPESIYGDAGIPHGYGFPSAYLWDDGREAAIFFNMTPMRWMSPESVWRFHDVRIMTRNEPDRSGLGMHFKKVSGSRLPAGEMVVEFYLYQDARQRKPTGLEALDTMVRAFAPLHPSQSVFPDNRLTGIPASWEQFGRQAIADLISSPRILGEISAPWRDSPLELVPAQQKMIVHPGSAAANGDEAARNWDFSTVNNHLTPWLLLARLDGHGEALRLALLKKDALPRFYDPRARLIRHGTSQPPHVGDLEMAWQNLYFHEETLRAASAAGPANFNPAVVGRFLMATAGLRELAANVDYVFPQWFDPYLKQPVVQNDVKKLGKVREPWQAGSYARLMVEAFQITGQKDYLNEAKRSIDMLMERMRYRVRNDVYDRAYADPSEFPITELFGNAYGILASRQVFEATGESKYLRYSRDFMNTLLRLTFWYEDESDAVSRELRNAGLFYPHCGAVVATPWETSEAHLILAQTLKDDKAHPLTNLLLKLSNLNRINAFYFYPATWSERVLALDPSRDRNAGNYFPIEPFYTLGGNGGHRGQTAAYMAGAAMWNDWLYEALAEATDREVMALNLDAVEGFEPAISGVERHFIVYNPGPDARAFRIIFKHLTKAEYIVKTESGEVEYPAAHLTSGLPLRLGPNEHIRITLRSAGWQGELVDLERQQTAMNRLACAYKILQERAETAGNQAVTNREVQDFEEACRVLRSGR